jgi:hypothetical protein
MTTINVDYILVENKKLAKIINDIGEILFQENTSLYSEAILSSIDFTTKLNEKDEKKFLYKLYYTILDKLKELNFHE